MAISTVDRGWRKLEKAGSDTGSGVDAKATGNPLATYARSETGTGVEAKASENPLATFSRDEIGSGVEALIGRAIMLFETGSGVDTVLALLGKKVSETGSGVENSYLHILEGVKSSSDTGEGADASSLAVAHKRAETGVGVEAVVARALYAREYPTGAVDLARVLTAAITGSDVGAGVEASLQAYYLKATETGSGVDASTLKALFSRGDVGAGAEAITLSAAMVSHDTGVGIEEVLTFFRKLIDSGKGEENLHLIGYIGRVLVLRTYTRPYRKLTTYTRPYRKLTTYTREA